MPQNRKADRHAADTVQLNIRVPRGLRDDFEKTCLARGCSKKDVLSALMRGFIEMASASEVPHGGQ